MIRKLVALLLVALVVTAPSAAGAQNAAASQPSAELRAGAERVVALVRGEATPEQALDAEYAAEGRTRDGREREDDGRDEERRAGDDRQRRGVAEDRHASHRTERRQPRGEPQQQPGPDDRRESQAEARLDRIRPADRRGWRYAGGLAGRHRGSQQ